jgi:hypothetical protein
MKIAKIVGSNSHIAYIARVLDERDGAGVPTAEDYGFGRFVEMLCDAERVVGIIFDSRLVNPEYANYAPRTAQSQALGEIRRELSNEQKALVGILLLGSIRDGVAEQRIPHRLIPAGCFVETMEPAEVASFHKGDGEAMRMHYFPQLMAAAGSLAIPLAKTVIDQLTPHCTDGDRQRLAVMSSSLTWKHTFGDIRF